MLNIPIIHDVDLQPQLIEEADLNLCIRNYVLFSMLDEEIHIILSHRHLAAAFDYLAKQTFVYPIVQLDDDSFDRLYNKFLEIPFYVLVCTLFRI